MLARACTRTLDDEELCGRPALMHWAADHPDDPDQIMEHFACATHAADIDSINCICDFCASIETHPLGPECGMPGAVWCSIRGTCHQEVEDC
jgi:hypothetical protein